MSKYDIEGYYGNVVFKIKDLINSLNKATELYEAGTPIVSDEEWDKVYFILKKLEEETGIIFPHSPTQSISYNLVTELEKIEHNHKMLSLDKTKDLEEIKAFMGHKSVLAMLKLDGLTCSLTYENGVLIRAETRGNGLIGENILHNAKIIPTIPKEIPYKETLIVDGEVICLTDDFEKYYSKDYKNPRNFAAGSIRLLDSTECARRGLKFIAWEVIEGFGDIEDLSDKLLKLHNDCGFMVAPWFDIQENLVETVEQARKFAKTLHYPIDGLVFKYDNIAYGKTLGETSHHFKNALAYKFYDETYQTYLRGIDWTMGRTGVLTPVAIFDPIDIDGSVVERANLHNLSVMEDLLGRNPHDGQPINVFKANMIIPQIKSAERKSEGVLYYYDTEVFTTPEVCPICGGEVTERTDYDSTVLVCQNPQCNGKLINKLDHFCGKKGLDIKGLSKATLEKLISWDYIDSCEDIFTLYYYRDLWIKEPGFGEKSVDNILNAIEKSKNCSLSSFICALGIPLIGTTASKELAKVFITWENFIAAVDKNYQFCSLPNFGIEMDNAIMNYDYSQAKYIAQNYISFETTEQIDPLEKILEGKTFVITGKLNHFKNRDTLKEKIESLGGKVVGSVSKNTTYLINNDINSTSSKNKTAQSLGIPILSEETFIQTYDIQ